MTQRKKIPDKLRDEILREAGYRCGTTLAIHLHHIDEVKLGGGDSFENLLALCPTCHSLYHAEIISGESVRVWKARLRDLHQIGHDLSKEPDDNEKTERRGFALAAAEFDWRTCQIGLLSGPRFKKRGFCVFVAKGVALTTLPVVTDLLADSPRHGTPHIWTDVGMAPFELENRFDASGLAAVRMGKIDDEHVEARLRKDESLRHLVGPPLQTTVRFRLVPFVGEHVGLLHAPVSTAELRGTRDWEFETAAVSYMNRMGPGREAFRYTLSTSLFRVRDEGAPVFDADSRLVGILTDSFGVEEGRGWRHHQSD